MKFINFLNEKEKTLQNLIYVLTQQVKPEFLKMCYDNSSFLYRGQLSNVQEWDVFITKQDRKPLDMPLYCHMFLDEWFKKNFGWKVRSNGVFCTNMIRQALEFGKWYYFFPIGPYKYVWSNEIEDLYSKVERVYIEDISKKGESYNFQDENGSLKDDFLKVLNKYLKKWYTGEDIKRIFDESEDREIVFKCYKYLLIDPIYIQNDDKLLEIIKEIL